MIKRIITTTSPAVICSAMYGVQAGEQIVPQKDLWELHGIRKPERVRIHEKAREEAWARSKDRDEMQEIATGLEVSIDADENSRYKIVLWDESDKKIIEAHGTAEEVELLRTMKTNEERATFMQMKELMESGEKPGFAGWKARVMYAIKNSKFVQGLATFWTRHGNKVKTALKITGAVGFAALGALAAVGTLTTLYFGKGMNWDTHQMWEYAKNVARGIGTK